MKEKEMKKLLKDLDKGKHKCLKPDDKFQFKCTACGKCCFNQNIVLSIYDVIRLRTSLQISTKEIFKKNFVNLQIGYSSGLPILTINFKQFSENFTACPFLVPAVRVKDAFKRLVGEAKTREEREKLLDEYKENPKKLQKDLKGAKIDRWLCSVHKNRPMICRLYPLGRIKVMDKNGKFVEEKMILQEKEDWCPGWKQKHEYTLKSFLDECEFWHYKEGSDKSHAVLENLITKGFVALTKDNKKAKIKPLFKENSKVLMFIANLLYNFDSFNYFSRDKKVVETIYNANSTHKDFMYVLNKVDRLVNFFINSFTKEFVNEDLTDQILNNFIKGGGEIN